MAISGSVNQTEQSTGGSGDCFHAFHAIIDRLCHYSELGSLFYSRCSDSRIPVNHAKKRLMSINDERFKTISRRGAECSDYLKASEHFFDILRCDVHQPPHSSLSFPEPIKNAVATRRPPSVYLLLKQPVRFYGRDRELEQIGKSLGDPSSVTIRGIAGVGKTSIALRLSHLSLSNHSVIIWIKSEGGAALDQGCHEALRRLQVIDDAEKPGVEIRQKWRDYLARAVGQLVVFDNVERSIDLDQFWPLGGNGKILVTTRHPGVGFQLTDDETTISPSLVQDCHKLDHASKLVGDMFPKEHTGQRFTGRWDECAKYIQHAISLSCHYLQGSPDIWPLLSPGGLCEADGMGFLTTISRWMIGHDYIVLGNGLLALKRYEEASQAYSTSRSVLSAPGKQLAVAIVLDKLGYVAY
ncbi:P-loop containing nucleoside triphosphate hydrolase protein [Lasiosphaeria miniovina]|uniref:P-loop containing nucleoside triphosphate hydrolase protein n=1 Tax=Lasiosphaeria miniovina TaxID=1954250 RepID=A0AA40AKM9_9PEZI|nr:P-loop containing nucleoside triphosphate hydrolase protein [Lasiosphaeria miniovina]KAK0717601.1 P-loop containing nucleoside triphosphate hydrolase protein [Lasiosphaeria miniovina]